MCRTRPLVLAACVACCLALGLIVGSAPREARLDPFLPAVRHFVEAEQQGRPDYDAMEPGLRQIVGRESGPLRQRLRQLGKLETLSLLRNHGAERIYELWFEDGRMLLGVTLSPAGKFAGVRAELHEHR